MKSLSQICFLLFLLLWGLNVNAMDLVSIPTADLIPNSGVIRGDISFGSKRVVEGIFNINPRLEVGGMLESSDSNKTGLGVRAKTLLTEESERQPAISAGIKMTDIYFVMSKNLAYSYRAHLGLGSGRLGGVFFGFSRLINSVKITENSEYCFKPAIVLMGEYLDQKVNIGARINFQNNIKLDAAVLNFDSFKLGLAYSF